jgi:putative transcriptional regulator
VKKDKVEAILDSNSISDEQLDRLIERAKYMAKLLLAIRDDPERVKDIPTPEPLSREEIRELRRNYSVSQKAFARLLNVSVKTVQSWEQGTRVPSDAALKLLSLTKHKRDLLLLDFIPDPD